MHSTSYLSEQSSLTFDVSLPENLFGLFVFFIGIRMLLLNIPSSVKYTALFVAGFSLFIGLWFLLDYYIYHSLSAILPGFLLPLFSLALLLDFFFSFPLSYGTLVLISSLLGGSLSFCILAQETNLTAYKGIAWILFIIPLLHLISNIPFAKENVNKFWPILLIIVGVFLLGNQRKNRKKISSSN